MKWRPTAQFYLLHFVSLNDGSVRASLQPVYPSVATVPYVPDVPDNLATVPEVEYIQIAETIVTHHIRADPEKFSVVRTRADFEHEWRPFQFESVKRKLGIDPRSAERVSTVCEVNVQREPFMKPPPEQYRKTRLEVEAKTASDMLLSATIHSCFQITLSKYFRVCAHSNELTIQVPSPVPGLEQIDVYCQIVLYAVRVRLELVLEAVGNTVTVLYAVSCSAPEKTY